jgi:hypothetical protein
MAPRLSPEARVILQRAVDSGGSYSIHGLTLRELARAADLVFELQRFRFVHPVLFRGERERLVITVEITDVGRNELLAP